MTLDCGGGANQELTESGKELVKDGEEVEEGRVSDDLCSWT